MIHHVPAQIITHQVCVPHRAGQQMLQRIRRPGARCSAIDQQFFRSRSPANIPSINSAACRRGSCRVNLPPIRSSTSPNASHQRSGFTLCAAATAASSLFHTNTG